MAQLQKNQKIECMTHFQLAFHHFIQINSQNLKNLRNVNQA